VGFHTLGGVSLLEAGHFKLAKAEFEAALVLAPTNEEALNGRYLADLFLEFESPDWNPAVGLAVQDQLTRLIKQQSLRHVIEKYLGDLYSRTNQFGQAQLHYEKALGLRPEYSDALCALGWFHYTYVPDLERMETYFRRTSEANAYDYRGFHGLGYSLYMRALREESPEQRNQLMHDAAKQSDVAKSLSFQRYNIMVDFGEVSRCVDPRLSLFFHSYAMELLEDPTFTEVNPRGIFATLLQEPGQVLIKGTDQLRAWINYQLALDCLAMHRLGQDPEGEKTHDAYFQKARDQDVSKEIFRIYSDQLAILDYLTGTRGSHAAGG
jgi:tetratricopeptide (TPR) repeat protein